MLKNRFYYLAAALLMGSTFLAACGDDDPPADSPDADEDVDLDPPRENPEYSYLSAISFPGVDEESGLPTCCADLNGDDVIDNALAEILPTLGGLVGDDLDVDTLLQGVIDDGDLILIFEHNGLPVELTGNADFDMTVYVAESEDDAATRAGGDGNFTLGQSVATITGATYRAGVVNAEAEELTLTLDLAALGLGDELPLDEIALPLTPALIFANVEAGAGGGIATSGDESYLTGGVGVGLVAEIVNGLATECGIDGSDLAAGTPPLLSVEDDAELGRAVISCNYEETIDDQNSGVGTICDPSILGIVCGSTLDSVLGGFLDVDTTGNDILDGISLGLFIEFAGVASVTEAAE